MPVDWTEVERLQAARRKLRGPTPHEEVVQREIQAAVGREAEELLNSGGWAVWATHVKEMHGTNEAELAVCRDKLARRDLVGDQLLQVRNEYFFYLGMVTARQQDLELLKTLKERGTPDTAPHENDGRLPIR